MFLRRLVAVILALVVAHSWTSNKAAPLPMRKGPADGPLGMKFVRLPKGTFYMGGGGGKAGRKTEIKEDFEMAVYTVTQGQWEALMADKNNLSYFSREPPGQDAVKDISDDDLRLFPVENVSWNDAEGFIKKLNEREKGHGWVYRLPTEAEWEFACRGGATSEQECSYHFYFDKPTNDLSSEQANFNGDHPFGMARKGQCLGRPTKVGSFKPNKAGLYDMHGNVWQWCSDSYKERMTDRVLKGGSWDSEGERCRAAHRGVAPASRGAFNVGFRLVRVRSSR